MRKISLLLVLVIGAAVAVARPIYLQLDHTQNGLPFQMDRVFPSTDGSFDVKVTALRYYVSEITVIHDGGKQTLAQDVFLLVDASKPTKFFLADMDVQNVERVVFSIGVPIYLNHNDPAKYPAGHPWVSKTHRCTGAGLPAIASWPLKVWQVAAVMCQRSSNSIR